MNENWWIVTQTEGRVLDSHVPINCPECEWRLGSVITTYDPWVTPMRSSWGTEKLHCDKCGHEVKR